MKDVAERKNCILIATDVLGRGVDIQGGLDYVIQEPDFLIKK
jgi:superfamily II DNA/RNA helicase